MNSMQADHHIDYAKTNVFAGVMLCYKTIRMMLKKLKQREI